MTAGIWGPAGQTPTEVLQAIQENGWKGERCMRALASVDGWSSPVGEHALPLVRETGSARRLAWFSNNAIQQVHCGTHGLESELFFSTPGHGAFAWRDVDAIDVDPGSRFALSFEGEERAALQRIAETTAIEAFLHGAQDIDRPFARMRTYAGYRILSNGGQWMLAPDSQGRSLLAICTSPATEQALREQVERELGHETTTEVLTGAELFGKIPRFQKLQGMVFNPSGPVAARAMALGLAQVVLTRDS